MQVTWVRPPFPLRDNKKMLPRPQKASVRFWKCKWTENSVAWRHKRIIIIQMWLDICILKCFHPIINYQKAGRKGMKIISGRGKIKSKYFKTSHSTKFTWRQTSTFHLNCFRIAVIFFFWLRFFFWCLFPENICLFSPSLMFLNNINTPVKSFNRNDHPCHLSGDKIKFWNSKHETTLKQYWSFQRMEWGILRAA